MMNNKAKYVWYEKQGQGRNLYGMFRKTFEINKKVKSAQIKMFADTYYQLFINGEFIEFGPARFDPRFPLYDTHDIGPYLKQGSNAIAVLVNYFGCKTYKAIENEAGFIAWGTLELENNLLIDLSTYKGSWKCKKAEAYSRYASKISFALNQVELYDQSFEESGWKYADFDDESWSQVVEIDNQDSWGELRPRMIPYMSGNNISASDNIDVLPLVNNEELHSFSVEIPNFFEDKSDKYSNFIAFSTWIYSPIDQKLNLAVFWGDGWLNGKALQIGRAHV